MKSLTLSRYIGWMALNSFTNSCSSVLSTHSMLGSIMTTPSYTGIVTTTYIGKDILGQLGGLYYSWRTGNKADTQPMKYVMKGSLIQQAGYHLENLSILINNSNYILPFLGVSTTIKNISFISIGAVNARNLQKLAMQDSKEVRADSKSLSDFSNTEKPSPQVLKPSPQPLNANIGELYAKVASINTLSSTMGMILGIGIVHYVPSYSVRSCVFLPFLSFMSLYSVRRATMIAEEEL